MSFSLFSICCGLERTNPYAGATKAYNNRRDDAACKCRDGKYPISRSKLGGNCPNTNNGMNASAMRRSDNHCIL